MRVHSIYLGGPVDYAGGDHFESWQHWSRWRETGMVPYCPRCECRGLTPEEMFEQNRRALIDATVCILDLRSHSIGTPIELYLRGYEFHRSAILVAPPGSKTIEYFMDLNPGLTLVSTPGDAYEAALLEYEDASVTD